MLLTRLAGSSLEAGASLRPRGWAWLTSRLRARTDSEHEQAILRIILGSLATCYLVPNPFSTGPTNPRQELTTWFCGMFLLASVLLFAAVVRFPARSPVRRCAGIMLDTGATSLMLLLNGEMAAPLFVVYLWVTFGNGFRYGLPYLAASAVLGVAGFTASVSAHDLWRTEPSHCRADGSRESARP